VGLYVHVPFCMTICPYCAFYKVSFTQEAVSIFIDHLLVEMNRYHSRYGRLTVDTIFFGGGTPNVLSKAHMSSIMTAIHTCFNVVSDVEFSMEMNPGIHSISKLQFFKDMGVNRVSVGAQSFSQSVLDDYGRRHSVSDTLDFICDVRSVGFNNVSVDIMFGHLDHQVADLKTSLQHVLDLKISHVALYGLAILEGTPFGDMGLHVDDDQQADQYAMIQDVLTSHGYGQYEVSNFALDGFQCRHNIKYWTFQPTVGLGPGAHSFFNERRYANAPDYQTYLSRGDQDDADALVDVGLYLATRLRYLVPINHHDFLDRFGEDVVARIGPKLKEFSLMGWMILDEDGFMLSDRGCLVLDELVGHFS